MPGSPGFPEYPGRAVQAERVAALAGDVVKVGHAITLVTALGMDGPNHSVSAHYQLS